MKRKKPTVLIVSVHRDGLVACGDSFTEPISIPLPVQVFRDLEVIDQGALEKAILAFVTEHKLASLAVVLVLSRDVCFEKEIGKREGEEWEQRIQEFIDTVPFTTTSAKTFQVKGTWRLIVINRSMYEALRVAFEKSQCPVTAVIPGLLLSDIGIKEELTAEACRVVAKKREVLREQSFLKSPSQTEESDGKPNRFFSGHWIVITLLTIIIVGWIGAMAFLLVRQRSNPADLLETVIPTITVLPSPEPTEPVSSPSARSEAVSIQILNGSRKAGVAAGLAQEFAPYGFTDVQTANAASPAPHTTISFSPTTPDGTRKLIFRVVQALYPEVDVLQDAVRDADIVITIGLR